MASTIRIADVGLVTLTTTANVLAGNRFEFMPRLGHVAIYAVAHLTANTASVAGVTELVVATISFGNVVLADAAVVQPSAVGLRRAEHLLVSGIADGGDRLIISNTNGTGVTVDIVYMIEITDL